MFIVSNVIDLAERFLPQRTGFQIRLKRIDRWRTFEHGYHLLPMLVDPDRAAVDVGANEGYYAGKMAQLTRVVHCFEPIPWLVSSLESKLPPNVIVHQAAVSDSLGKGTLRIPYKASIEQHGTTTIEPANPLGDADYVKELECEKVTLDDAISDPIGLVKIDVEGHELSVLKGAKRIVSGCRPVVMIESERRHHSMAPEGVFQFFNQHDYTGIALLDSKLFGASGFTAQIHQDIKRTGRNYVNSFIFIPNLKS